MNYTRQELINIFQYNYERTGIVESIYRMMSHLRSISLLTGVDKKALITDVVMSSVTVELEEFISQTIEFLYQNIIVKNKKPFFSCIR